MTRAERVIAFIETLPIPDGADAGKGKKIMLRDWQKKIIRAVYDTVDASELREVRQAVLSMGRKNGKTALVAGLCMAHLCGPEAISNGQLYSVAYDRGQAAVTFKLMYAMIRDDQQLTSRLNVLTSQKQIIDPISGSEFTALSSESKGKHGKSSSFIVFDELAQFGADRELYDIMMTSRGAHADPLVWCISTQAANDNAVLSELIDYGQKVNNGEIRDPKFKNFLFAVPDNADPWDEANWYLANPALGDFRSLEEMRETAEKAKRMPNAESSFRNLYLNQRVSSEAQFIARDVWNTCGDAPGMDAFYSSPVVAGLDLSAKNDLTALVLVAPDGDGVFHTLPFFWKPADLVRDHADRDRVPYDVWAKSGDLLTCPGKVMDYRSVALKIMELREDMDITAVKFDRWNMEAMRTALEDCGCPVWEEGKDTPLSGGLRLVPHGQGFKDMTKAVEALEDCLLSGRLRHGLHPVLTMCAGNTRVVMDGAGNRKFDKQKATGRIDGIVALSMALNGALTLTQAKEPEFFAEVW